VIETAAQSKLVARVKALGGWAKKKSNRYNAGIPDLDVLLPGYPRFDVEVKHLGKVGATFKRQVETTPLQDEVMRQMNAVNPYHTAAIVAVTHERGRDLMVQFIPATQQHVTHEDPCFPVKTLSLPQLAPLLSRLRIFSLAPGPMSPRPQPPSS
jgi:hypothetical protein